MDADGVTGGAQWRLHVDPTRCIGSGHLRRHIVVSDVESFRRIAPEG
ncbi:hypothetical protein [Micromonospora coerulea]|nr:hypothetical protein [Micromonospora veneta]